MELPSTEKLNLHPGATDIGDGIGRFELWCSIRRDVKKKNETAFFLTAGGRSLYSLMKNLAFPRSPASVPLDELNALLINHIVPFSSKAK